MLTCVVKSYRSIRGLVGSSRRAPRWSTAMQACDVLSYRTSELSLSDKCSREWRDAAAKFSGIAAPAIERCKHKETNRRPASQPRHLDSPPPILLQKPTPSPSL